MGTWTILRPLAVGGMGAVYAAQNRTSGAVRALKVIRPDLLENDDARARFVREVMLASRVRHPNVVESHDPLVIDGQVALPMELLEGETLAQRLGRGPLDLDEAVELVATLCRATAAFHAVGIIHRDLKPANVFLSRGPDGRTVPKILDLGAAREIEGTKHTQTGHTIGSPAYMAPEQARGQRDLDGRVDVYALGVLLYVSLTCKRPVESDEHGSAISKLVQGVHVVPPSAHRPEIPPELDRVVMQAMAHSRDQRYPSAQALEAALTTVREAAARPVGVRRPPLPMPMVSTPRAAPALGPLPARRWYVAALALLALLGLALAGTAAFVVVWSSSAPATVSQHGPVATPTVPAAEPSAQPADTTPPLAITAPEPPTPVAPPPAEPAPPRTTNDVVVERASRVQRGHHGRRTPPTGSGLWLDDPN